MFYTPIDTSNRDVMIAFLKNHFRYYTASSWNMLTSYANNVKLYNLELTPEQTDAAYKFLTAECPDYELDAMELFEDFKTETGYRIGYNGRSSGYLVLYDDKGAPIDQNADFDDWDDIPLKNRVQLVSKFDQFCDKLRDLFIYYLENYIIQDIKIPVTTQKRIAVPKTDSNTAIQDTNETPHKMESDIYYIVGYDKDNDHYDDLYRITDRISAEILTELLTPLLLNEQLRTTSGEPYDWLEIHDENHNRIAYTSCENNEKRIMFDDGGCMDMKLTDCPFGIHLIM